MPMGHANGTRKTVTLFRKYTETYLFILCFWRQHSHDVAKQFGFIARYSHIYTLHPDRLSARGFQWHRHDFKGRAGMPMGRQEQSLYSENRIRALGLLCAFGDSIHMKLPSNLVSLSDIHTYLRTCRDALGKRISVAQARFQRQRGPANGARLPIASFREYKQSYQHFLSF